MMVLILASSASRPIAVARRQRAARLIVEGTFGVVVSADALSGNVEQRWRGLDR
ncbi:hypothetical protein [Sphingobium sp. EP60837]|uniref:hypothetical protein n=1 Tax=Sphingobium sp. EP60837 TaxID=1855519 RepID=UPI001CEDE9FA|nr:hypothetical protein [Sphingobium sp. EP60837]